MRRTPPFLSFLIYVITVLDLCLLWQQIYECIKKNSSIGVISAAVVERLTARLDLSYLK